MDSNDRNPIREARLQEVEKELERKGRQLTTDCRQENAQETKTKAQAKHIVGKYPKSIGPCVRRTASRSAFESKDWHLPPNCYDATKVPFKEKSGSTGAYWCKLPKKDAIISSTSKSGTPAPIKNASAECKGCRKSLREAPPTNSCNKYKGVFLTNARERIATARSMVSDPVQVYRSPTEPSPAHYALHQHELSHKFKHVKSDLLPESVTNPHRFWRMTCVPSIQAATVRAHTSFQPAPGRYETRYVNICACTSTKEYMPDIQWKVDREKRHKFRRKPYRKYKIERFCTPELAHVRGRGHRHLFSSPVRKPLDDPKGLKGLKEHGHNKQKRVEKQLQLYADAKYIRMINTPIRRSFTMRDIDQRRPPTIRFNCMAKPRMRRHKRNDKKIAFNSGTERFPDSDFRLVPMTAKEMEEVKSRLPVDRQLRDHPIFSKPPEEIKSQLHKMPDYMKPAYEVDLRKPGFKFLPIPQPKILVYEKDLLPEIKANVGNQPSVFYNKPLNPLDFIKKEPNDLTEGDEGTQPANDIQAEIQMELEAEQFELGKPEKDRIVQIDSSAKKSGSDNEMKTTTSKQRM